MKRRIFSNAIVATALGLALSATGAIAAEFPSETIRLIVPYKPGGGTDTIARAFAKALESEVGVAVVIDNVPGSAGINGMLALAKSQPDGYTLAINGSTDVSGAVAFRDNTPIKLEDFACAGGVFNTPAWILSHADNGYNDLGDFLDAARANPGKLNFGITGALSPTDFVASVLKGANDVDFNIINFGGGGPLKKAILANQVAAGAIIAPVLMGDVKAGELKVLAAAGDLSGISYEPVQGTGHIGDWNEEARIDVAVIRGIFMPSGVPEEVQAKIEALVKTTVTGKEFTDFAENFGYAPFTQSAADYCTRMESEVATLNEIFEKYMDK